MMRKMFVIVIAIIISFSSILLFLYYEDVNSSKKSWISDCLGKNKYPITNSLIIDEEETPHIVYRDYDNATLIYSIKENGVWKNYETPISKPVLSSFALDDDIRPHIAYFEDYPPGIYTSTLKYAFLDGGEWKIEVVDKNISYPEYDYLSISADSNGYPHIAYYDGGYLKYAYRNSDNWTIEIVDEVHTAMFIQALSIVMDENRIPHISYVSIKENGDSEIKYTYWNGTEWNIQKLDNGTYPSLFLDGNGFPHISYYHTISNKTSLKYAVFERGKWHISVVEEDIGEWTAPQDLVIDRNGRPHLLYYSNTTYKRNDPHSPLIRGNLIYAEWKGGKWKKETIERDIRPGASSLAVGNVPHIVYEKGDELMYLEYSDTTSESVLPYVIVAFLAGLILISTTLYVMKISPRCAKSLKNDKSKKSK